MRRRRFLATSLTAAGSALHRTTAAAGQQNTKALYNSIRWTDEQEDPSITLETERLVCKIIDNTGLRVREEALWTEPDYSHHLGYHGIRAFWDKNEKRNIVAPFVSWLNLQGLSVEGLRLDPVDPRTRFGVGRGWPVEMYRQDRAVELKIPRMPVSAIEYRLTVSPLDEVSFAFEMEFVLGKKDSQGPSRFQASWPCYMSTFDEVELYAPVGEPSRFVWKAFGEREDFVVGEPVNYRHSQRRFDPPGQLAFPAVYGRIGERVLILMTDSPKVSFFLMNAGGHRSYLPVQNPAWDFSLDLPDYQPGVPFGIRGCLTYKEWTGTEEIVERHSAWVESLSSR